MSDEVHEHQLTQLIHSTPVRGGNYRLYLYEADGFHSGGQWFTSGRIRYPEEQIAAATAKEWAEAHIQRGLEVRITDAGDFLVFHSHHGKQLWPASGEDIWSLL